jgi:hypothetical protein
VQGRALGVEDVHVAQAVGNPDLHSQGCDQERKGHTFWA